MSAVDHLDLDRQFRDLEAARAGLRSARHVELLDVFVEHLRAERRADLEGTVATLIAEPRYNLWGQDRPGGRILRGRDEVRRFYAEYFESDATVFERSYERVVVGDDGLFTDGLVRRVVLSSDVVAGRALQPDSMYVVERQAALVVSFEGSLMVGEDTYAEHEGRCVPLDASAT
jgi:hypothetical protein